MKKVHKVAAVGASMTAFALVSAALAVASPRGVGAATGAWAVGSAKSLPNTNIKGHPAHFRPSKLSAHARWNGTSTCGSSQASFTADNKEGSTQTITFSGAASGTVIIPGHARYFICVRSGSLGKMVGTLSDGKRLSVHLS